MNNRWIQDELPFEKAPEGLRERIRQATTAHEFFKPTPPPVREQPTYKTGFVVLVSQDGEVCVATAPDFEAIGFTVSRPPAKNEIERAAHIVVEYEKQRSLVDSIVDRLQPRDLVQESLRNKARERGVV